MIHHDRLVAGLAPIRQMFLAQAIQTLLSTGLADHLRVEQGISAGRLAATMEMDESRLIALLEYCEHEGLVESTDSNRFRATARLRSLRELEPWYEMLVGGYGGSFLALPELLTNHDEYAPRDVSHVARGSSGISRHDSIPVVLEFLSQRAFPSMITDLGSADGVYLQAIAERYGDRAMVAVEPNETSASRARDLLKSFGRISVVTGTAQDYVSSLARPTGCFIISFVLHEVLAQDGPQFLVGFLRRLLSEADNSLIITEVDRSVPGRVLESGIGSNYYNPYFLLHAVTRQKLIGLAEWRELIAEAGGVIQELKHPSQDLDPTCTEFVALVVPKAGMA